MLNNSMKFHSWYTTNLSRQPIQALFFNRRMFWYTILKNVYNYHTACTGLIVASTCFYTACTGLMPIRFQFVSVACNGFFSSSHFFKTPTTALSKSKVFFVASRAFLLVKVPDFVQSTLEGWVALKLSECP